jgi:hypothetical protein
MSERRRLYRSIDAGYDLLPPERPARQAPFRPVRPDVTDAEFVVIETNAAKFRDNDNKPAGAMPQAAHGPLSLAAAARLVVLAGATLDRLTVRRFAVLTAGLALAVFWLAGGFAAWQFGNADSSETRPVLAFHSVAGRIENANGLGVLVVTGAVENASAMAREVPEIRLDLAEGSEVTQSARIAAPAGLLAPGQTAAFSVRLNHAGGKLPEIRLSFAAPAGMDDPL